PRPKTLFGLNFPNPVGLAAGLDKNGVALPAWAALGFGFIEIGTVTAKAQPGNPEPRIFRLPKQRALINRLGFNNDGADAIAERLRKLRGSGRWPTVPVGINIGKSRATSLEKAADDYLYSFRLLRDFADYVTLNVSSPNTPGLRELQEATALSGLLRAIGNEPDAALPGSGTGGVCNAECELKKFQAGAEHVQLYTEFVYRGPRLLHEIIEA